MKSKKKICSGCGEDKVIWKNHEGEKYCQYCWNAIKFKKEDFKPVRRKPPVSRSKKQVKLDQLYSQLRKQFLEKHPTCQAGIYGCQGTSTDIHHKAGRGKNYLVVSTWLSICRHCHSWVHEHPADARELDLLQ